MNAAFPSLTHLFSCYFHEDFDLAVTSSAEAFAGSLPSDAATLRRVVQLFQSKEADTRVAGAEAELGMLLAQKLPDEALQQAPRVRIVVASIDQPRGRR